MSKSGIAVGPGGRPLRSSALVLMLLFGLVFLVGQSAAFACSRIQPPTIEQLAERSQQMDIDPGSILGVYQQETLVRTPNMGLRQAAAATKVTRYWGIPPNNIGVEISGGEFFLGTLWFTDCEPDPQPPTGRSGYGWTDIHGGPRFVWVDIGGGVMVGELSPNQVEALDAAFGVHTTLEVKVYDRVQAAALAWWPGLLVIVVVVGVLYLIIRRLRERSARPRNLDSA